MQQQQQQQQQQLLAKSKSPEDHQSVRGDCEENEVNDFEIFIPVEFDFQGCKRTFQCNLRAIKRKRLSDITYNDMASAVISLFEEEFAAIFGKRRKGEVTYILSLIWTDNESTEVTLNSTHELQIALNQMSTDGTHFHFRVSLEPQPIFRTSKDESKDELFSDDSSKNSVIINITCDKCWKKLGVFPATSSESSLKDQPKDAFKQTENNDNNNAAAADHTAITVSRNES